MQTIKSPIVSVVVPVYNAEKYLPEAIEDLQRQTLRDAEFIFVDDGSTDSSLAILQSAAEKDSRIRILHQEHKYAGCARNLGMEVAKGKWFIALDADDRFEPDLLELSVARGEETDAQIVIFDADRLVMPSGKILPDSALVVSNLLPKTVFKPDEENEAAFRVMATWTKLYRLSWVKENDFRYQGTYESNDILFTFLTLSCASRVVALSKTLLHYRVGEKTNIQSTLDKSPLDGIIVFEGLKKELIARGVFEEYHNIYATVAVRMLLGRRITKFKTSSAAELFFNKLKDGALEELGLEDISKISFVGSSDKSLSNDLQAFHTAQTVTDWLLFMLNKYCIAKDNIFFKFQETKVKLNSVEHNQQLKIIKKSLSYQIGLLFTFPIRVIFKLFNYVKRNY